MKNSRPRRILASQTSEAGVTIERTATRREVGDSFIRMSAGENEALQTDLVAIKADLLIKSLHKN